jgi:hypothetical protein
MSDYFLGVVRSRDGRHWIGYVARYTNGRKPGRIIAQTCAPTRKAAGRAAEQPGLKYLLNYLEGG